jgi:hypothetical protein
LYNSAAALVSLAVLDEMIARAEASCAHHRRAAAEPDLNPSTAHTRRQALQQMETALSRLRAQGFVPLSVDPNIRG